jgi:hypothetical protein
MNTSTLPRKFFIRSHPLEGTRLDKIHTFKTAIITTLCNINFFVWLFVTDLPRDFSKNQIATRLTKPCSGLDSISNQIEADRNFKGPKKKISQKISGKISQSPIFPANKVNTGVEIAKAEYKFLSFPVRN